MKVCFKCGDTKPLTSFYRYKKTHDGRLGKCKECTKADVRENRRKRIEYYRAYDRARGSRRSATDIRAYRASNPEKYAAHTAVGNAVRDGRIRKPSRCERCGKSGLLHGHHDDYSKPLSVMWLCVPCHHARHAELAA